MNTQREQLIQTWLQAVLQSDQFEISFLAGDASFRRYARIKLQNKTYMLMDAPPEKEDCIPFVSIDEFFDGHGVRVPHIVAKDLTQGLLLLEDFGDVVLSTLLNDETVDQYYAQSFKQLIELQQIDGKNHLPAYYWADISGYEKQGYEALVAKIRNRYVNSGYYDAYFVELIKRLKCLDDPKSLECRR